MTQHNEPIISVSGLRGVIGAELTPATAVKYVSALAATLPRGKVVIGRDGRGSGKMLAQAVSSTLVAHGLSVVDLEVAATPTVGVAVREQEAVAGVQISASHNPKEYNGLKLFGSSGRVLPKTDGEAILQAYRSGSSKWVPVDELGSTSTHANPHSSHHQKVLATVDHATIQSKKFRVLLDSNHGAGSLLARPLLESLGCEFEVLGDQADGQFAHPPEPLAENLQSVCERVKSGGFHVGFCQDPDADRLAIIDEKGNYIGEELTLALCLMQALPKNPGVVVTNCATSSLSRHLAEKHGCTLMQSAVGEANVADLMIQQEAVFGGEGNGGPIDPQVGYVRDSFVGMARILELLATSGQTISDLVESLPPLAIFKDKVSMSGDLLPGFQDQLVKRFSDATATYPDGLKLDWGDRWLLVRGSNTEPIVRLIAEAASVKEAQEICKKARALLD